MTTHSQNPVAFGWRGIGSVTLIEAEVTPRGDLVEIPYRDAKGKLYLTRVVTPTGPRWWRPKGRRVILFGLDRLPNHPREDDILFLCEGESDTLAVRDSIATLADRRVFALGLPGAATWRSKWATYLKRFATLLRRGRRR
jgi:hypothetical protein